MFVDGSHALTWQLEKSHARARSLTSNTEIPRDVRRLKERILFFKTIERNVIVSDA